MMIPFVQAANYTAGRRGNPRLLVIHTMEAAEKGGTAEAVAGYFRRAEVRASAHFCIDNDSIVQCVRVMDVAWHCKNANSLGIGLEHAGYARQTAADWADPYSWAVLARSAQLAGALCRFYGIPVQRARFAGKDDPTIVQAGLCGHNDVPLHGSHTDPGPDFPWARYLGLTQAAHAAWGSIKDWK